MHEHMPKLPPLAALDIENLEILAELFATLAEAAMNVANQPRCNEGKAGDVAAGLWDGFWGVHKDILDELRIRQPTGEGDVDRRARVILQQMSGGHAFTEIAAFAIETAKAVEAAKAIERRSAA